MVYWVKISEHAELMEFAVLMEGLGGREEGAEDVWGAKDADL